MQSKRLIPIILLLVFMLFHPLTHTASAQASAGPRAFLPEAHFEFSPVLEGREIRHGFMIQNKGTAPLIITDVRTD